jgi:quercetin dioxygenase-like cupin family protein
MQTKQSLSDVRRVVTGERSDGASYVVSDGSVPHFEGPISVAGFWATAPELGIPVRSLQDEPAALMAEPAARLGQTRFGAIWYPPRSRVGEELIAAANADGAPRGTRSYPGRHATMSYDYIIVMQGEIWLQLDEEEILLKAGDIAVQGGVAHSWHNRSDEPCLFYCIIIGADRRAD